MSSEKTQEVLSCDASIMKNVWEIRTREHEQKLQKEEERREKSALPSINQDWANRLASRQGSYKRVERKPKRVETDNDDIWKSKPQVPPTLPRGVGSAPLGRPGVQSRGFSSPASSSKDKKGQDKNIRKLQLLMFLTQNQPSSMVWGKSWKYNKSLPVPAEGDEVKTNWGQCWKFATLQPYSEPGKPWVNGPNLMDPRNLQLWMKTDYRMVESKELDLCLPTEDWQMSWRKSVKNSDKKEASGESGANFGFFTMLVESQHHNEALCSSEWCDSWRSTKPASEQHDFTVPDDGQMNVNKQNMDTEMSSEWEECWKLANQHGCNNSKLTQVQKSCSPEWVSSWRAATVVPNNQKTSEPSLMQDGSDSCDNRSQQRVSAFHKVMMASRELNRRDLYLQLCDEVMALSEWSKAWQVTKNNTKPCEEIEKILKASTSRMETTMEVKKVDNNHQKGNYSTSEKTDSCYEQLKHDVIYHPKREFAQSQMQHLKHLENSLSFSDWKDSWKALKHRMRMERRRMRPDPSRPFRASDKGGDMKPSTSEWKDSWKFNCQPLRQEPEQWQQGWSTMMQMRVDRVRDRNHFAPVVLPSNGPTGEPGWMESWRISRRRHQPGQGRPQTSQARSSVASHHHGDSRAHRRRSVSDWQVSWMVSETQFHHDRPSLTQWRDAWRWSVFEREDLMERVSRENQVDMLMEIQPQREKISLERAAAKMSRSFDNQMFRERYPEKEWNASWRAESLLNLKHCGSSGAPGKTMSCSAQQQHTSENGHSKWGMSFRLANPMPNMEQPWVESSPNPCHYTVMWSRPKKMQKELKTNFSNNPTTSRLWVNSYRFLQGSSAQKQDRTMSKKPVDPKVIMTKKSKSKRHLYSKIEEEKQFPRSWAGCHLLGKTQPRPKRGAATVKDLKMEDKTSDKFFEEWAESWRFLVRPGALKKQGPVKSLTGWDESWKFLIPPFQPVNGPKAR